MTDIPEKRAVETAKFIIKTKCTVREAAREFGVSKSTVHKDVTSRLKKINLSLYDQTAEVLQFNKQQRHIRGGLATKRKYELKRKQIML